MPDFALPAFDRDIRGYVQAAPDEPTPVTTINEFIPEDVNLTDCISAVPPPGCGSEARTSWEQGALLAVLVVAIAFIAWRVVRSARRARNVVDRDATGVS